MAASVRLDDEAFNDLRFEVLAQLCRLADGDHARSKLARLWRQCTAHQTYVLTDYAITAVLGETGPDALVKSGLGERVEEGIRMRGTKGRIEWLAKLRANAQAGGEATKRNWENRKLPIGLASGVDLASQTAGQNEAKARPEPGPPIPIPTPINSDQTPVVPARRVGRPRKPALSEPTPTELESVRVVLAKLGLRNGVTYTGSKAHVALIVGRLRDGFSEMDLRKVIGYCAERWRGDEKMAGYLRPETLFGPTTIARYVDAARAWFASLPSERHE